MTAAAPEGGEGPGTLQKGGHGCVFLFDVDNTLLDNDRIEQDLSEQVKNTFGDDAREEYWRILEQLRDELDYVDHLGALERFRLAHLHDPRVLRLSSWLLDYSYAQRLFPCAQAVIDKVSRHGTAVILSDGDAVLQPRKIERSGLWDAVNGNVLIFVHKEKMLADVERLYPARHYVLVDDKLRVLAAVKQAWQDKVTTVWPRQGHYARDRNSVSGYPRADMSIGQIADLCACDWRALGVAPSNEEMKT